MMQRPFVRAEGVNALPAAVDGPPFADSCVELWCAVLAEGWRQAFRRAANETPQDVAAARRWFGTRDFYTVCALAGFDGDDVMRAYRAALANGAARGSLRMRKS